MEPVPLEKGDRDAIMRHFVNKTIEQFPDARDKLLAWVDAIIPQMMKDAGPGDELWICRSRYIGPLAGHEGLGVVRDGKVVKYQSIRRY